MQAADRTSSIARILKNSQAHFDEKKTSLFHHQKESTTSILRQYKRDSGDVYKKIYKRSNFARNSCIKGFIRIKYLIFDERLFCAISVSRVSADRYTFSAFSIFFQDPLSFWLRLFLRPFNGISWLSSVRTPWYFLLVNVDHGKLKSRTGRSIEWKKIASEACAASRDLFAITKPRAAPDTLIVHCAIVWFISLTSATHARPYRPCILARQSIGMQIFRGRITFATSATNGDKSLNKMQSIWHSDLSFGLERWGQKYRLGSFSFIIANIQLNVSLNTLNSSPLFS